jgi:general secretion pathway protein G
MNTPNRSSRRVRSTRRAFSLVELIVAITIMAILAAIVVPNVNRWLGFTKSNRAKADAETISNAVRMHMSEHGLSTLPGDFELVELTEGDNPQLKPNQLLDPWTNPYQIRVPGEVNFDFDVYSMGSDGQVGGEGEAADVIAGDVKKN